ncbi:hypothetical protein RIF29_42329 [Crotalaria pallida]|uniref:Uncharacterized protein n=1 Tax=Crotalaria pallida TaxID=3830 RepID=A0AAN9E7D2_CROPI
MIPSSIFSSRFGTPNAPTFSSSLQSSVPKLHRHVVADPSKSATKPPQSSSSDLRAEPGHCCVEAIDVLLI